MRAYRGGFSLLIVTLLIAVTLQACATPGTSSTVEVVTTEPTEEPEVSPETVKVKVVTLPFITFAPYYIAQEEGFFAEQGLEIEFVNLSQTAEVIPALSSGQVDVSSGLLTPGMFNAIARGADIRITSDKGFVEPHGCVNWGIVGRSDLVEAGEFEEVSQLKGKTVLVVEASWLEYFLTRLLESGGLTIQDISKTYLNSPEVIEAFAQKQIDVAANSEPWITRFSEAGNVQILTPAEELLPDSTGAVMMYGPGLLGENEDVGVRFMVAYLKGVEQYNEGKTERNLEIIRKFTELDMELLEKMCWPAIRSGGALNMDSILDFQKWAIDAGYLDSEMQPEEFFDPVFLDEANAILDTGQ
jgi:NitT/TauT family transport system substrate-binding protein